MNANDQKFIVQKIRTQYTGKESGQLDELKKLDRKVKRPANLFACIFGTLSALIMGFGMSLIMTDFGEFLHLSNSLVPGVIIGCVGLCMAVTNYPIFRGILTARRKKYASRIVTLSDRIMAGQSEA